jgi:uncharacterized phage-like protein YoqJ
MFEYDCDGKLNIDKSCAFTGHRSRNDEIPYELLEKCIINLIERGVEFFYCGMARGFDIAAAEIVIKLKEKFNNIKIIACVPCVGQEKYFSEGEQAEYEKVLISCDEVKVLSQNYYNGCMQQRDRFMVDNCKYLIAFLRQQDGGTYYTFSYARSLDRAIFVI